MRRTLFVLLRLGIGIGLLVYLVESKVVDPRVFARLISSWPISVLAIALLLVDLVLMAWRLCCLFRARGMPLAFVSSFELTALSSFFASFLPGRAGGDVAKVFYASREIAAGGRKLSPSCSSIAPWDSFRSCSCLCCSRRSFPACCGWWPCAFRS